MYNFLKLWLFNLEPEHVHDLTLSGLAFTSQHPGLLRILQTLCTVQDQRLETEAFGLTFPNPIGLAAGMDKNARAIPSWAAMGFGFVEIGSITAQAQPGNPKPRLFRLPDDEAIINRMGFNNDGADVVAARLKKLRETETLTTPIGINLGKSKVTPLEEAHEDYKKSLELLYPYGDYFVINVSSPNTPGLRELQDRDKLEILLTTVQNFVAEEGGRRRKEGGGSKPVLLKIAPDLTHEQLDEILELAERYELSGLIATNTTIAREGLKTPMDETGGLSGKPLTKQSLELLKYIRAHTALPIISVGGIFTERDVFERLEAGAVLVQIYTALIYQGPMLVKRLNKSLLIRHDVKNTLASHT
ncbi:MAG: quinone-dependent dihydroorotate dehydrogenase [Trueperaceae bacterium]